MPPTVTSAALFWRMRFSASLTAANGRGLKLSAKLLAVAHEVEGR